MFRQALDTHSDTPNAWHGLALIYTSEGRIPEAIMAYRKIIVKIPGFDEYQLRRGAGWWTELELALLQNSVGNVAEAIALYRDSVFRGLAVDVEATVEPVPLTAVFEGVDAKDIYSPARFESVARIAFGIMRMRDSRLFRGVAGSSLGAFLKPVTPEDVRTSELAATEQFRKATKVQPDSGLAQFYLGYTLTTQGGDKIEAQKALDKAILYGTEDIRAAVRELRATGTVSPPPVSGSKLRERIRESLRLRAR